MVPTSPATPMAIPAFAKPRPRAFPPRRRTSRRARNPSTMPKREVRISKKKRDSTKDATANRLSGPLLSSGRYGGAAWVTPVKSWDGAASTCSVDQLAPSHQRICPNAPLGSGYQPACGPIGCFSHRLSRLLGGGSRPFQWPPPRLQSASKRCTTSRSNTRHPEPEQLLNTPRHRQPGPEEEFATTSLRSLLWLRRAATALPLLPGIRRHRSPTDVLPRDQGTCASAHGVRVRQGSRRQGRPRGRNRMVRGLHPSCDLFFLDFGQM